MTLLPALFALFSVFIIRLYPLNDETVDEIQTSLTRQNLATQQLAGATNEG